MNKDKTPNNLINSNPACNAEKPEACDAVINAARSKGCNAIPGTDPATGLSASAAKKLAEEGFSNTAVKPQSKSVARIVADNVFTYFNLIFAVLAVLLVAAGSYKSLTFMPVVLGNIVIGIAQELRAKSVLDKLTVLSEPMSDVVRDGEVIRIPSEQLVLGDIAVFGAGSQICADAVVRTGEVYVSEALLTGESAEIRKLPGDSLLSGSFAVSGECRAVLTRVGEDSYAAQLTKQARAEKGRPQSEMIRVINIIVRTVGIVLVPVGTLLFCQQYFGAGLGFKASIVAMVAAVIGMIPEGLYLLTSVALLVGMIRLARRKVLLHDMNCIETLARVDVLCVDKTGTITDGSMKVNSVLSLSTEDDSKELLSAFILAMPGGNDTDRALKAWALENRSERQLCASEIVPFSSKLKYASAVIDGSMYRLGAPEFVLGSAMEQHRRTVEKYSSQSFRVLVFARNSEALAFVLIENSIRKNAAETFGFFEDQGVAIKVISGDNPVTVSRVAASAGIAGSEKYVDASSLSDSDLYDSAEELTVFGRVVPEQKKLLVKALKDAGHTVGMTGDGVNDILALKDADCSIAMASGCDAAAHASKMVLLDSDFSAMPHVVAEGRRVVNNIQRSASLFLVKNIFSLITALFSVVFAAAYPLEPSQVSLIAAFTIGIPGFFLALAPCNERIKGSFLGTVLARALPSGLTDAFAVILMSRLGLARGFSAASVSTACTALLALIGILTLVRTCLPLNAIRAALIAFCSLGLAFFAWQFDWIFGLVPLSPECLTLLAAAAFASVCLFAVLSIASERYLKNRGE